MLKKIGAKTALNRQSRPLPERNREESAAVRRLPSLAVIVRKDRSKPQFRLGGTTMGDISGLCLLPQQSSNAEGDVVLLKATKRAPYVRAAAQEHAEYLRGKRQSFHCLCSWCKYGNGNGEEVWCEHPLEVVCEELWEIAATGGDCWGFRRDRRIAFTGESNGQHADLATSTQCGDDIGGS